MVDIVYVLKILPRSAENVSQRHQFDLIWFICLIPLALIHKQAYISIVYWTVLQNELFGLKNVLFSKTVVIFMFFFSYDVYCDQLVALFYLMLELIQNMKWFSTQHMMY